MSEDCHPQITEKGTAIIESGLTLRQAHEIETACTDDAPCVDCLRGAQVSANAIIEFRTARLHEAVKLLEYALHLRMYGERAPGGNETWVRWDVDVEKWLRDLPRAVGWEA